MGIMCLNLRRYAFMSLLIRSVLSGSAQLTFSRNPVYSGDPVTLTVTYGSGLLVQLTVDAFKGTLKKGSLSYVALPASSSTGIGVFDGQTFTGWQNHPPSATNISTTLTATPSLELDYNCTARVSNFSGSYDVTCEPASVQVNVYPLSPRFQPSPIVFNDSDSGILVCESRNGTPAAALSLTLKDRNGVLRRTVNGNESAPLNLSLVEFPLSTWHNAVVTCRVTNHDNSSLSVTEYVKINYITNTSVPGVIYRNESVMLNCSTYISYYPGVLYNWTALSAANITASDNREWITVPQGLTGSFYCTATNNITLASVVIIFTVSNSSRPIVPGNQGSSGCELCWLIGLVLGIIVFVIIAVVLGVLCKRGHFSKGKKKPDVEPSGTDPRSDNGNNRVRLLIVAEGVVTQLSLRTLHTTAIVEYSHRSCSLNDILEKVKQAVSRSSRKFKSVALLLHAAKVGVTLSDVDQAELNSSSIQKEKGEKLRTFISRLAEICLDERGGTRMDILNYNGKAPVRLSEALTNLLGIPATVSRDQFGVGTPTDDKGGHAFVANDYFDSNNLGEIVYAELQPPSVKPPTQPHPAEERVIYSEIKR